MREWLALLSVLSIGASALVLLYGVAEVRRGRRQVHHRAMLVATSLAALFLFLYLVKAALFGGRHYAGPEGYKAFYLALLGFHSLVAALNVPLVLGALYLAFRNDLPRHRQLAPWVVANWLLVALTGWAVWRVLAVWGK